MWDTIALAVVGVVVALVVWTIVDNRRNSTPMLRTLAGPLQLPLIGNLLDLTVLNKNTSIMTLKHWRAYGNIWKVRILGQNVVVLADADDIAKVAKSTKRYFQLTACGDTPMPMKYGLTARVLFDLHGDEWKKRRVYVQRAFDQKHTRSFVGPMSNLAAKFAQRLCKLHGNPDEPSKPFDMMDELRRMMMDAMGLTVLGVDLGLLEGGASEPAEAMEYTIQRNAWDAFMPWFIPRNEKKLAKAVACFGEVIQKRIDACSKLSNEELAQQGNIISLLVLAGRDEASIKLTPSELSSEVFQYCVAGFDTSKCSLGILFHHLATHPEVQDKVRREIVEATGNGVVSSLEQIMDLKYLSACVDESQRLQPIVPMIDRVLEEDVTVTGGREIPKGMIVFMATHAAHMDSNLWGPDTDKYIPERQLTSAAAAERHRMALVPFGAGPKRCVGFQLASMQVRAIAAAIIAAMDLKPAPGCEKLELVDSIVLQPTNLRMLVRRL